MAQYVSALDESVRRYDSLKNVAIEENYLTPYHFRMFAPPTLYQSPLRQTMDIAWTPFAAQESQDGLSESVQQDSVLMWTDFFNARLMDVYTRQPQLITLTERELSQVDDIREELIQPIRNKVKLAEKTVDVDLGADVDAVDLVVKKPNFWKFSGSGSLQFSQSYFSDNWYKGGEDNYTMLGLVTLELKYNNKQRIQWENKLEMKLGFQTMKSDEEHKLKTNEDLLRLTSKLGYQASKHWFYTTEVQASTQFYPSYQSNSKKVQSDFMSPFYLSVSVGMDYKLNLKRFNLSAYLAPVAYKLSYVDRADLASRFGMKPFHVTKIDFGPNITVNYKWNICKNVQWDSRAYWFSNLKLTTIEWENTFSFTINKYLASKLFLYPRLDDSSKKYWSEDMEGYFMFREWFSLGLNYSF
ncbi:MAG: DUF3078 domain-containing protein [Clostridium sp.]|nr:DUF3078 domain-containing protein [Clostridium sp.]